MVTMAGSSAGTRRRRASGMITVVPLLFSYGTLRDRAVQRANFGRELVGHDDLLPGYATDPLWTR
jgi:hypothetical protein